MKTQKKTKNNSWYAGITKPNHKMTQLNELNMVVCKNCRSRFMQAEGLGYFCKKCVDSLLVSESNFKGRKIKRTFNKLKEIRG